MKGLRKRWRVLAHAKVETDGGTEDEDVVVKGDIERQEIRGGNRKIGVCFRQMEG